MKKVFTLIIIGTLVMMSCQKQTTAPEETDNEAISELISTVYAPMFDYVATMNDTAPRPDTLDSGTKSNPWRVFAWGREILHHTRDILIHIENDTATVTINRDLYGNIHILVQEKPGDTIKDLIKPLHDKSERIARFVRIGSPDSPHRGWVLDGLSNVEINTQDLPDTIDPVEIEYVHVIAFDPVDDSTIIFERDFTDPLTLWNVDSIPVLPSNALVKIELKVRQTNREVLAFLHYNTHRYRHRRDRFVRSLEDSTLFVGFWRVPYDPGFYHVGFDIIHYNTFFTEDYPYVSNAWIFPYKVTVTE